MKRNALIFILLIFILLIFLILGIESPSADSLNNVTPEIQQQTRLQLSEKDKDEIYHKLDDKLKISMTAYKGYLDSTVDILEFFYNTLIMAMAGVLGINYFLAKKRIEDEVKTEVEKEIIKAKDEIKNEFEKNLSDKKKEVDDIFTKKLSDLNIRTDRLISLEHAKRQLLLAIEDIESPSIHHVVSDDVKKVIENYIDEIHRLQAGKEDIADTAYNNEIAGKAHHYLGTQEHYVDAIKRLNNALILNENKKELCQGIYVCLGNSYAGLNDYINALIVYKELIHSPIKHSCMGHAYKGLLQYNKANEEFSKIEKSCGEYYWESLYEQGNCFTALGEYKKAESNYKDASKLYKRLLARNEIKKFKNVNIWIHVSLGDFYWKTGDYPNAEEEYKKSLELAEQKHDKATIYYKLGRLYIDKNEIDNAKNCFSEGNYNDELFEIFRGYLYLKTDRVQEGNKILYKSIATLREKVRESENKIESIQTENKSNTGEEYNYILCDSYYNLAVGLAMKSETIGEAKEYLRKLIICYQFNFIKIRAAKANCSDFIAIREDTEFKELIGL